MCAQTILLKPDHTTVPTAPKLLVPQKHAPTHVPVVLDDKPFHVRAINACTGTIVTHHAGARWPQTAAHVPNAYAPLHDC